MIGIALRTPVSCRLQHIKPSCVTNNRSKISRSSELQVVIMSGTKTILYLIEYVWLMYIV